MVGLQNGVRSSPCWRGGRAGTASVSEDRSRLRRPPLARGLSPLAGDHPVLGALTVVVGIAGQFLLFTRFRPVPCAAWKVGCQLARACSSAVRAEVPNCWCGLLDRQSVPVV